MQTAQDVVAYEAPLPPEAKGPFILEARLWYRVATQEFAYNTLKTDLIIPPFELAAGKFTLPAGNEAHP